MTTHRAAGAVLNFALFSPKMLFSKYGRSPGS